MSENPIEIGNQIKSDEQIEELNKNLADNTGEWVNTKEYGLCWHPFNDLKDGKPVPPSTPPPQLLKDIVEWGNAVNMDDIKPNSVMIVKIGVDEPQYAYTMQMGIIKQVLEPRAELLKDKRLTVLFMSAEDDISIISEEDMERSGWQKKDKSRIITL